MAEKELYLSYLNEERYDDLINFIKEEIEKDDQNADNYYYLFLAYNHDYSNIDFNNLSSITYFNKAKEIGSRKQVKTYECEFNFYKGLSKKARELFCFACREQLDNYYNLLDDIVNVDVSIIDEDIDLLCDDMHFTLTQYKSIDSIILNFYASNVMYINTEDNNILKVLNSLIVEKNAINSALSLNIENSIEPIQRTVRSKIESKDIVEEIDDFSNDQPEEDEIDKYSDVYEYNHSRNTITDLKVKLGENAVIPGGIVNIDLSMTKYMLYVKNISIPKSLKGIRGFWFEECVENVYYDGTIDEWFKIDFEYSYDNPMYYANYFYILDKKGKVQYNGKRYSLLEEAIISGNDNVISNHSFNKWRYIKSLKKITIDNNVEVIDSSAFVNCNFEIAWGSSPKVNVIRQSAFSSCKFKNFVIPKSLKRIEDRAFNDCGELENVYYDGTIDEWYEIEFGDETSNPLVYAKNFYCFDEKGDIVFNKKRYSLVKQLVVYGKDNKISRIDNNYYKYIKSLKKITISNDITMIGSNIFEKCQCEFEWGSSPNIERICSYAFRECQFKDFVIPKSLKEVGREAFYDCNNLENVYYDGSAEEWYEIIFEGPMSNPLYYAKNFYCLDENGTVDYRDKKYSLVDKIVFSEECKTIKCHPNNGYSMIKTLKSIVVSNSVETIENSAFWDGPFCGFKCDIIWGDNPKIKKIGDYAFYKYEKRALSIPSSVEKIGFNALNSIELREIYFDGTIENWCNIDKEDAMGICGKEYIRSAFYKKLYIFDPNGEKRYQNKVYSLVEEVTIPSSFYSILPSAFYNISGLKKVTIQDGAKIIYFKAFSDCIDLEEIEIPKSVEKIYNNAFKGCDSLISVYYNGSLADWNKIDFIKIRFFSLISNPKKMAKHFYILDKDGIVQHNGKTYSEVK